MKPFEQQRQFNPSQGPDIGSGPLQAPDIASQMEKVFADQQNLDRAFLNQMGANQQMETANLQNQFKAENLQAEFQHQQLQQLGQFSEKLLGLAKDFGKKWMDDRAAEGKAARLDMDMSNWSPESVARYNEGMAQLRAAGIVSDQDAARVLRETQDFEVAQRYQSLGQYQQVGFAKQHMAQAKVEFPSYLTEQMQSNDTLEIRRPDGTTFTPSTASNSAERAAAASVIYKNFVKEKGFAHARDEFVEQFFAGGENGARAALTKTVARMNKHDNVDKSQRGFELKRQEALADLESGAGMDLPALYAASGMLLDAQGNPLSHQQRWTKMKETIKAGIDSGAIKDVDQFLATTTDPLTGKPLAARKALATELRNHADTTDQNNYTRSNNQKARAYSNMENNFIVEARSQGGDFSKGELEGMQRQLEMINGQRSAQLDLIYQQNNLQVQNKAENKAIIEENLRTGTASMEQLQAAGLMDDQNLVQQVQQQEQARKDTNDFADQRKILKTDIETVAGLLTSNKPLGSYQAPVLNSMMRDLRVRALELMRAEPGLTAAEAGERARIELLPAWQEQGFKPGETSGKYAPGTDGHFDEFNVALTGKVTEANKITRNARAKYDKDIQDAGTTAYTAGMYVSKDRLESNGDSYLQEDGQLNPNYQKDPLIQDLADRNPDMNYLQVLNKLRTANGLDELPPPPSLFKDGKEDETIDPNVAKLLERAKTSNQTLRAGLTSPEGFISARVPPELTPVLKKVASGSGLSVELVTAIAQAESSLDPNAISEANADGSKDYGLFQINNQAHPEYTYTKGDIEGNANQALVQLQRVADVADAKGVLPEYRERFMLAGYNQGQNSIPVINGVPQFNAAHNRYIKHVYKQMGGLGVREVLNQPSTMRGAFYITGDIGGGVHYTGQHLDVKRVDRGYFDYGALDNYVEVDDPELGRVPLSGVPQTGDWASHTRRGSHGRDYGTYSGSPLYLKGGAKLVPSLSGPSGDGNGYYAVIELPNGTRYSFLHGSKPQ